MSYFLVLIGMALVGIAIFRYIKRGKSEEKTPKKPIFALGIIGVIIFAVGSILMPEDEVESTESAAETIEPEDEVEEEPEPKLNEIAVNEGLSFVDFSIKIGKIKVEGNTLKIPLEWANDSFPDKTKLMQAASIDVKQGDKLLDEVNNAWFDPDSDVYFPNAPGGSYVTVKLEYELADDGTPITITIVPHNDYDDNKKITFDIK